MLRACTAWPSSRPSPRPQQLWRAASQQAAPGPRARRRLRLATAAVSSRDDDRLPDRPVAPESADFPDAFQYFAAADRYSKEMDAYIKLVRQLPTKRQAAKPILRALPPPPSPAPLAFLGAPWTPVTIPLLASGEARAATAEAAAAAAVAFAGAALGHEAAAEAARAAADTAPASALATVGEEWLRASTAWRKAFESLEAAQQAQPGGRVVLEAAAEVEAARRAKSRLRSLAGGAAADAS